MRLADLEGRTIVQAVAVDAVDIGYDHCVGEMAVMLRLDNDVSIGVQSDAEGNGLGVLNYMTQDGEGGLLR